MKVSHQKLPLVISVPHGGFTVPNSLASKFLLSEQEVLLDCDTWERELYDFKDVVEEYIETDISRLIIDMNRSKDDLPPKNPDGIVKTLSVARKQVWSNRTGLLSSEINELVKKYYDPYHQRLKKAAQNNRVKLGIDCHTMLKIGPASAGSHWEKRPIFCIGNRGSKTGESLNEPITAPVELMIRLKRLLEENFADFKDLSESLPMVTINVPFAGGYITKCHGNQGGIPWIQLEINRCLYLPSNYKQLSPIPNTQQRARINEIRNRLYETFKSLTQKQIKG